MRQSPGRDERCFRVAYETAKGWLSEGFATAAERNARAKRLRMKGKLRLIIQDWVPPRAAYQNGSATARQETRVRTQAGAAQGKR